MHRNVQPSDSEGSLTPPPLICDKFASSGKYGTAASTRSGLPFTYQGGIDLGLTAPVEPCNDADPEKVGGNGGRLLRLIDYRDAVEGHALPPCATAYTLAATNVVGQRQRIAAAIMLAG
jgi:hypothetical protein